MNERVDSNRRGLRALGCMIKAPLGCMAFFLGALVVLVIFFPPACGNMSSQFIEDAFAEKHFGSLEVKEAWLGSVYGPQKVESVILRDPQGQEILHAALTAPSLFGLFAGDSNEWGPVDVRIPRIQLVEDEDGVLNLDRALALRNPEDEPVPLRVGGEEDLEFSYGQSNFGTSAGAVAFAVAVDLFSWRDARGHRITMTELECFGRLMVDSSDGLRWEMSGTGKVEGGDPDGVTFDWSMDDIERLSDTGAISPWTLRVQATQAPVALLELLAGHMDGLATVLGRTIQSLDVTFAGGRPGNLRLEELALRTKTAEITGSASWDRAGANLSAADGDSVRVDFPVGSWWTEEIVYELVPLVTYIELEGEGDRAALGLTRFSLPLREPSRLSAICTIEASSIAFALPKGISDVLSIEKGGRLAGPITLELDEGRVRYESFRIPTKEGDLVIDGEYDLRSRAYDATLSSGDVAHSLRSSRDLLEAASPED